MNEEKSEAHRAAKALLDKDDQIEEARWHDLDEAQLNEEIELYRAGVQTLTEELAQRGSSSNAGEETYHVNPRHISGIEGREGVDFHYGSVEDVDPSEWQVPPHCVPIHANVTTYNWKSLYQQTQFDVIMMDPPWQLATSNPTRGVALGYSQLNDNDILSLPLDKLQKNGFLFIWVINAKYAFTMELFEHWGYELVDEVVWVKMTVNKRLAKSHGYYLQHAKEVCLVGRRGSLPPNTQSSIASDVIYSERRGQSQKPEEIYHIIEELVPGGRYLEIFGRKNNLRNYWVTIGNEVTGTGLPTDDIEAIKEHNRIPGAVYGGNR